MAAEMDKHRLITSRWLATELGLPLEIAQIINDMRGKLEIAGKAAAIQLRLTKNRRLREWIKEDEHIYQEDAAVITDLANSIIGRDCSVVFTHMFDSLQDHKTWVFYENDMPIDIYPVIQMASFALTIIDDLYSTVETICRDGEHSPELIGSCNNKAKRLARLVKRLDRDSVDCATAWGIYASKLRSRQKVN